MYISFITVQIFLKELKQLVVQNSSGQYKLDVHDEFFYRDDISLNSDDLEEIGKYYEYQKALNSARSDLAKGRTLKKIPIEARNLKTLFFKTLEKLHAVKSEKKTMEEKVFYLQNALEFKDIMNN